MLESRGGSAGYLSVVRRVMDVVQPRPGKIVLEVGCGSGVLDRWLARYTKQANRIMGVDVNKYLLREAMALAVQEHLADVITFQEGDAEALPFPDNHVDVAVSLRCWKREMRTACSPSWSGSPNPVDGWP
jgi:ubiquinone/menaquinone biosynthesis C-methylase UbiE